MLGVAAMFAGLQLKRKLEEALSAQDDVTPGASKAPITDLGLTALLGSPGTRVVRSWQSAEAAWLQCTSWRRFGAGCSLLEVT